jgi:hypothetical protein
VRLRAEGEVEVEGKVEGKIEAEAEGVRLRVVFVP